MNRLSIIGLLLAALAAASTNAAVFEITEETNANYQTYLKQIGSTKRGAFAVTEDGFYSYYIYCLEISCNSGYATLAREKCKILASGRDCILMQKGTTSRLTRSR
jgi:hypothetical protein